MYPVEPFRTDIIRPALVAIDLWSQVAENLMLGTALQESLLTYTHQIGGPALGYFQMEPATHDDCFVNFLNYRHDLKVKVLALAGTTSMPPSELMETNHLYAAAMCRIRFLRAPGALPTDPDDVWALGKYYKQWYNTPLGAATVQEYVDKYNKFVLGQ